MFEKVELLVFEVDDIRCALPLDQVVRVEPAVAVSPLINAPAAVCGLINIHGDVIPVINVRKQFGRPAREILLEDYFIIACKSQRMMALWVNRIRGVERCELVSVDHIQESKGTGNVWLAGMTMLDDRLIPIHDSGGYLTDADERRLLQAMEASAL